MYNSQAMYIQMKNKNEGDILTVTVNMPDYFYQEKDLKGMASYIQSETIKEMLIFQWLGRKWIKKK